MILRFFLYFFIINKHYYYCCCCYCFFCLIEKHCTENVFIINNSMGRILSFFMSFFLYLLKFYLKILSLLFKFSKISPILLTLKPKTTLPIIITSIENKICILLLGTMSPYPTVTKVVIDQ